MSRTVFEKDPTLAEKQTAETKKHMEKRLLQLVASSTFELVDRNNKVIDLPTLGQHIVHIIMSCVDAEVTSIARLTGRAKAAEKEAKELKKKVAELERQCTELKHQLRFKRPYPKSCRRSAPGL